MVGFSDDTLAGEVKLKVGQSVYGWSGRPELGLTFLGTLMQLGGYATVVFEVSVGDALQTFYWSCPKLPAVVEFPYARFSVVGFSVDGNVVILGPAEAPASEKKPVKAEDAVKTLRAHLGRPAWLQAVTVGSEGGQDVIRLLTNSERIPCQGVLQNGWEGFPVTATHVGPLRLLSEETNR